MSRATSSAEEELLRVRVTGPLEPFVVGFAAELARQGFAPSSAVAHLRLTARVSRWLEDERLAPAALFAETAERFCEARRAAGYTKFVSMRGLGPLLGYLRREGVIPLEGTSSRLGPVEALLDRFGRYLKGECGLAPTSVDRYAATVRPFVEQLNGRDGIELTRLNAEEVRGFVLAYCPRRGSSVAKLTVVALRALLCFLYLQGEIESPLADAVPSVASWRLAELPKRLELGEVQRLLDSCDRSTASGRRDLAILTVLARLGMRVCEVAALSLGDVDWQAGEITLRGKGRSERLPLPVDVGQATVAYLRDGRPANTMSTALFVCLLAPYGAMSRTAVSGVVARASGRAGLGSIYGHRLRHTAASEMLMAGADLREIGQVLGHRSVDSTAIYAKCDRRSLREIARPWPGALS
jgi:integrase/recombinase XerD